MAVRVVVDPNVWVAVLISGRADSASALVHRAVMRGAVTAIVSPHLLGELAEVARREKFRRWFPVEDGQAFASDLADIAEMHLDPINPPARCRDPKDDYLLALMDAAGAILITYDKDLLDMAQARLPIVSPQGMLTLLDG